MTVKTILSTKGGDVISIEPTATLETAVKTLTKHRIGALLVLGPDPSGGTFELLCAELCGAAHYAMRAKIVVDEESEYQAWLRKQKTFAQLSARTRQAKETQ